MDDLVVVRLVALVRLVVVRAWFKIYVEIKLSKLDCCLERINC